MKQDATTTVNPQTLFICILILLSSVFAAAQHEQVLYSFGTSPGDGIGPSGNLIADSAGNFYGATGAGGAGCCGTVYELSPPVPPSTVWTETLLYSFTDGADGGGPIGSLVFDAAGNLYGTTNGGGNSSCFTGCGIVFELSPPATQGGSWIETAIYTFGGGSDAANPYAGLVFDQAGNLYGTTELGGVVGACGGSGCGAVFELSPPTAPGGTWTEIVLYRFTGGSDGGFPFAPLVIDKAGNLYGTTREGGSQDCELGCGTVFELTSSGRTWTETVLHTFSLLKGDGAGPDFGGLLLDNSGALAGTTVGGGTYMLGTVFGLSPPSSLGAQRAYGVLHSFGATQNAGLVPEGGVILINGIIYGTTQEGGSLNNGTVFQLARTHGEVWKETGVFIFDLSDGSKPEAGVLLHDGALYGTTAQGGSQNCLFGCGTVFEISP